MASPWPTPWQAGKQRLRPSGFSSSGFCIVTGRWQLAAVPAVLVTSTLLLLSILPLSGALRAASAAPSTLVTSATSSSSNGPQGREYAKCPLTYLPPHRPSASMTRCPEASELACCTDCFDYRTIRDLVTSNGLDLLNKVDWTGGISSLLGGISFKPCSVVQGMHQCQLNYEALFCALSCNPDAADYIVAINSTTYVMRVCEMFADALFDSCKEASLPIIGKSINYFSDAPTFFAVIMKGLLASEVTEYINFTVVADTQGNCYAGPKELPQAPFCCDSFSEGSTCSSSMGGAPRKPIQFNQSDCTDYLAPPPPGTPASSSPPPPPPNLTPPGPSQSYPICPFSFQLPQATHPSMPMLRCPMASESSCCGDCGDVAISLSGASLNATQFLLDMAPEAASVSVPGKGGMCDLLAGFEDCQIMTDTMVCGEVCNPEAGTHFNGFTYQLCPDMAGKYYDTCNFYINETARMHDFAKTPKEYVERVAHAVGKQLGTTIIRITVTETNCFHLPPKIVTSPFCCAEYPTYDKCPSGSVKPVYNGTILGNPEACAAYEARVNGQSPVPAPDMVPPSAKRAVHPHPMLALALVMLLLLILLF